MDDHEKPKELIATDGHRFWFFWVGKLGEKKLIECVDTQLGVCTMWTSLREETDRADLGNQKNWRNKMKNYAVEKIEAHNGNLKKQQQVGDNHIYHCRNPHIRFHVAKHMLENSIPSRYDLQYVIDNAKEQMKRY